MKDKEKQRKEHVGSPYENSRVMHRYAEKRGIDPSELFRRKER